MSDLTYAAARAFARAMSRRMKTPNAYSLTPSDSEVSTRTPLRRAACSQSQAAPRFAPEIPLSAAAVPHPKSPASAESALISKSTDLRLTHPAPTLPLPDPIPLKIQFPISNLPPEKARILLQLALTKTTELPELKRILNEY